MASETTLLGAAGEHYVMCELLRRGYIAALAPVGVPFADIVVTDVGGDRLSSIQVKTRRELGTDGGWHMKAKHETIEADRLFYCFVDFGGTAEDQAQTFVIPSRTVAALLRESHALWLATPGAKGQQRKDSVMRRMLPDYTHIFGDADGRFRQGWLEAYRNAWHLLDMPKMTVDRQAE